MNSIDTQSLSSKPQRGIKAQATTPSRRSEVSSEREEIYKESRRRDVGQIEAKHQSRQGRQQRPHPSHPIPSHVTQEVKADPNTISITRQSFSECILHLPANKERGLRPSTSHPTPRKCPPHPHARRPWAWALGHPTRSQSAASPSASRTRGCSGVA